MYLFNELLAKVLEKQELYITAPNLQVSLTDIIELQCYQALYEIKTIIEDDSLSDFDCIEKIVCVFENIGSDGGNRHDF